MVSWEGVIEFVAVAQTSSFSLAANKLDVSVVKVSRKVSTLENKLAVKLLHRTTRKVSLTDAGRLYYQQCKTLVEGLEQAELAVTQMQQHPTGLLRVTAPVTYGEQFIGPLLNQFLCAYPQLDIDFILTNQQLDLLDNGIDIAIRLGNLMDSSMMAKRLSSRQLYVCASPDYLNRYGEPHTLSEIIKHQCLVGSIPHWRFKERNQQRNLRISGRMSCSSGVTLLDAAKKGLGLVQLPDYYVNDALISGELVEVLSQYRDDKEGVWALYPQNRMLSNKVKVLIEFLGQHLHE
ncbi:LysR family transcriptional regulator [Parashewanella spongiae]|uniref:LysR family transcriptional regulator n=1 Tax=Parashewanella spongiae TaxID=342950 RepID=A0A3A6THT0_9GAMM|nr:LysR substrate-binding domain-containing protein [Parashewanella spongiae]MCL1079107.1 LysR substrate-binding domain-containing protein [Parashewanella spongiae]RJY07418.1 LysR family transcriptional regulator [Parashewanella spongiae]